MSHVQSSIELLYPINHYCIVTLIDIIQQEPYGWAVICYRNWRTAITQDIRL